MGFRPAVYRLALSLRLTGFVQNRRSEVIAEVQGDEGSVARFGASVAAAMPPAARIEAVTDVSAPVQAGETLFEIAESGQDAFAFPPIPPDLPLCADCVRELLLPGNRRYLYPFITCTQCGPRYSIVERTPFDRENTTMRPFTQCAACSAEYADPADRRFHSQTNSCAACGPSLVCLDADGNRLEGDPLETAVAALREGRIVAVHGIGGFHLAADPRDATAIARLRREKERERKPFALMVRDLEEARILCALSEPEEKLLVSPEAPIVIAPRRAGRHGVDAKRFGHRHPGDPAALHSPSPPAFCTPGFEHPVACTGHDVRQSRGRADHHRSREGPRAACGNRGCVPVSRPPHCVSNRRLHRQDGSVVRPLPPAPLTGTRAAADLTLARGPRHRAGAGR